jgi:hypothetical protein
MEAKGQWKFGALKIDWECRPNLDLTLFTYSGKGEFRAIANGLKHFMARLPTRLWLHDFRDLTIRYVYKQDIQYILERHIEPNITPEYMKLRFDGRDACLLGENDSPRQSYGISVVMDVLREISPNVKSFYDEDLAAYWLRSSGKRPPIKLVQQGPGTSNKAFSL